MANDTIVQYILKLNAKNAQKGLDQTAKMADKTSKEFNDLDKSGEKLNKELGKTGKQSKKATSSLKKLKGGAGAAAKGIAAVGAAGLAAVAGVVALGAVYVKTKKAAFEFTREVVDSVNDLNDLSAQSGLTAKSIQAVEMAFIGSGQSAGAAASFISRFPRLYADLASGAGRASEAAKKLGVSLRDANGETKDADQILREATKGLQAIQDPTERATAGFLLFGRSAGQFLQAFGATSNFENFVAITERFGVKTGPKASAEAAIFQESLSILFTTLKGLKQQFVNSLGGVASFNKVLMQAIGIVVTLQDFITENEKQFKRFGKSLMNAGSSILQMLQALLKPFSKFMVATFDAVTNSMFFLVRVMKSVGGISNKTFHDIKNATVKSQASMRMFGEILADLSAVDFTGFSGEGVGGRRSAKDIQEMMAKILAGVVKSTEDNLSSTFTFDEQDTDSGTGDDKGAQERERLQKEFEENTLKAAKFVANFGKNVQKEMSDLATDPAVLKAQNQLQELKENIKFLEEGISAGLPRSEEAIQALIVAEKLLADARDEAARKLEEQQRLDRISGQMDKIGIAGQVANLDLAGVAGTIDPRAGAIVGLIEALGSKSTEQLQEEALVLARAFANALSILPSLIIQILPQLTVAIVEAMIDGFLNIFVNLHKIIRDAFKNAFKFRDRSPDESDRERRQRQRDNRRQAFLDFFDPSKSLTYASGGRFVPSAQGGIRFTGMQDGMAMLHRGEFVVPQSGQRPQQVDRQLNRSGGGMVININSAVVDRNAVDALVREIEIRFNNTFGTSSSNLFGGR